MKYKELGSVETIQLFVSATMKYKELDSVKQLTFCIGYNEVEELGSVETINFLYRLQ